MFEGWIKCYRGSLTDLLQRSGVQVIQVNINTIYIRTVQPTNLQALVRLVPEIVSEYDQEIPQVQTADKPMASYGIATQQSPDTRKTNKVKQSIEIIVKLEWT